MTIFTTNSRVAIVDKDGKPTAQVVQVFNQLTRLLGGSGYVPEEFIYTVPGGTAYGVVYLNVNGQVVSTGAMSDGQLLIGNTGDAPSLGTISGTTNQVSVANGAGTITLSLPQDIHEEATPVFDGLTLSLLTPYSFPFVTLDGEISSTAQATNGQILIGSTGADPVAATITGTANRVTVTNAAGSITLSGPQDLHTGASPTFTGLTVTGLNVHGFMYVGAVDAVSSTAAATNGQLLIGSTGSNPVAATLTGTANQVTVTNGAGTITLSGPQDLAATSNVTFNQLTLTNGFGCNGASPQIEAAVNAAVAGTAGAAYTATEQTIINDLVALVNQLRTALVANGVAV